MQKINGKKSAAILEEGAGDFVRKKTRQRLTLQVSTMEMRKMLN